MNNQQTATSVANLIIKTAKQEQNPVTNYKLSRILFLLQGYYLAKYNKQITNAEFEKTKFGPLELTVYKQFKNYGSENINEPYTLGKLNSDGIIELSHEKVTLSNECIDEVRKIVKILNKYPTWKLYEIITNNIKNKVETSTYYTDEEIKQCFINSENKLFSKKNNQNNNDILIKGYKINDIGVLEKLTKTEIGEIILENKLKTIYIDETDFKKLNQILNAAKTNKLVKQLDLINTYWNNSNITDTQYIKLVKVCINGWCSVIKPTK